MLTNQMSDKLQKVILDVVDHFAGQTIEGIAAMVEKGLNGRIECDVKQILADMLIDGSIELDDNLHLCLPQSVGSVSKSIQKQVSELTEQFNKDSQTISPNCTKGGIIAKLQKLENGFLDMGVKKVRIDPYSHQPITHDKSQDGTFYFKDQPHNLKSYNTYLQRVGIQDAVHPYEWMIKVWIGNPLVNSNPRLIQIRIDQAKIYGVTPQNLFGIYWSE